MARFSSVLGLAVCLAAFMITARAQTFVTTGTEFYLAFPCNGPSYTSSLIVINSNPNPSLVTIDSPLHDFTTIQRTVGGNSALQIDFTDPHVVLGMQVCDMNFRNQQGFRVITQYAISLYVYQTMPNGANSAQYLVIPANMLAREYFGGYNQRYQGIVVAKQDNTQLTVGGRQITLNRLEIYYSVADIPVRANVPFAYILNMQNQIGGASPFSTVMALPKTYASMQSSITNDIFQNPPACQIWATQNNTRVSVNGGSYVNLSPGTPMEVTLTGGGTVMASSPVQVFSWGPSLQYTFYPDAFLLSNVQFFVSNGNSGTAQLMIVAPLDSTGSIQFDGRTIPALQYKRVPYSTNQYYYYTQAINGTGLHQLAITTLDDRYLAYVYYPYSSNSFATNYIVAMNLPLTS